MKKMIVCVCAYLIMVAAFSPKVVTADENNSVTDEIRLENHISRLYKMIDFHNSELLPLDIFSKAYHGYLNLRNAGKLSTEKNILTICNMALPSSFTRMWIIDLDKKKVLFNTYVAHGQGSGEDCSLTFSNKASTHKTSLGFYITKDTYEGEHGTSLHLDGMDEGYNDAALDRGIVVHGADYVSDRMVTEKERCGRSWGCPAVPSKLSLPIIESIKEGTCLFIYYPEPKYLQSGYWLNKKVAYIPEAGIFDDITPIETAKPKVRMIQYISHGKVDSVKTITLPQ